MENQILTQEATNTAAQLAIVFVIAVVAWGLAGRKRGGLFRFVGLFGPGAAGWRAAAIAALVFVPATLGLFLFTNLKEIAAGENTVAGRFASAGISVETIGAMLLVALVKTALAEEILFRGVLAKSLIRWFSFWPGAILQALVFGAVHALVFIIPGGASYTHVAAAAIIGLPTLGALGSVYINERIAGGSILPGWLMHAVANAIAYPALAFL